MKVYSLITLFPEAVEPYLRSSILKRAQEDIAPKGSKPGRNPVIAIQLENPRNYTEDKHKRVDQKPFAGGPGMVMSAEPVLKAAAAAREAAKKKYKSKKMVTIFLTPDGEPFTQDMAQKLSKNDHVLFLCGRYEGMDERVPKILKAKKVSIGPYVVTGGELPAAMMIDAIARHVPGVLGEYSSLEESRPSSPEVYTRPEVLVWGGKKHRVPKVLLGGNHKHIDAWRTGKRTGLESRIAILSAKVRSLYELKSPSRADWADWLFSDHVFVVAQYAHRLARKYKADADLCRAGGMLHDIADAVMSRFNPEHKEASARIATEFLRESGFSAKEIKIVVDDAMARHSCRDGALPQTLEGKIVATADAMAHLETDYYPRAYELLLKEGKTEKEAEKWILTKKRRDLEDKLLFDDEHKDMVRAYGKL
ncbi:MAG: tRNA ((1)-)-methyltransferase, tRNA (guanine37-N1)-methyltransferase [Candidatus Parcubacteria bacterium]|jgi:tRNA (guanine37-N1)-methyltransferase